MFCLLSFEIFVNDLLLLKICYVTSIYYFFDENIYKEEMCIKTILQCEHLIHILYNMHQCIRY